MATTRRICPLPEAAAKNYDEPMTLDAVLKAIRRALQKTPASAQTPATTDEDGDFPDPYNPFPDPVVIEFRDVLDLHAIPPRLTREVVEDYLAEAQRRGCRYLRIIHGKGIGVQRQQVRAILARTPFVLEFKDAPPEAGGWGATIVTLRSLESP